MEGSPCAPLAMALSMSAGLKFHVYTATWRGERVATRTACRLVSFRLGEGVLQDDVDVIVHGPVGVELGDDDPITVPSNRWASPITTTS